MGLFDFIGGQIQKAGDEIREAEMKAEDWDVEEICDKIKRVSNTKVQMGYGRALKSKAKNLSHYELERLLNYVYMEKNATALRVLYPIFEEHGLAYKDGDGKIKRK